MRQLRLGMLIFAQLYLHPAILALCGLDRAEHKKEIEKRNEKKRERARSRTPFHIANPACTSRVGLGSLVGKLPVALSREISDPKLLQRTPPRIMHFSWLIRARAKLNFPLFRWQMNLCVRWHYCSSEFIMKNKLSETYGNIVSYIP